MKSGSRCAVAWGLLPLVVSAAANAAVEADVQALLPLSLDELFAVPVVTASRREESRDKTPAHIVVVTREQIRDRRYRNLADLLEDLPGVNFMRGTRSSIYNNFSVQGFNSNNKLLIMLDGVRIDHPAGGKLPIAENFPLYQAKQIEILYGPSAALYGADAQGGVINIITAKPEKEKELAVNVTVGQNNSQEKSMLAGLRLSEEVSLTLGGHRQHSDRAALDRYYPGDFPRVDAKTNAGKVIVPAAQRESYSGAISSESAYGRLDLGNNLTFGFYRNDFRSPTSTGDRPDTAMYLDSALWNTSLQTYYGKYRFNLSDDLSGELLLNYSRYEVDPRSKYVNVFTDFQDHGYDYSRAWQRSAEQNFVWKAAPGHTLLAGLGVKQYSTLETPDLPTQYNVNVGPGNQGYVYPNTTLPIPVFTARYVNRSVFAQWEAEWNEQWNTVVGARYDNHSSYGSSVNPRLGVVWKANARNIFKLMYGKAFRAPPPEDALSAFGTFTGQRDAAGRYLGSAFRVPNYNLMPEKSRTWSATWEWRPQSNLSLTTNAYLTKVENLITTLDEKVSTQYLDGALLSQTTIKGNAGNEKHYGLDVQGQWRFELGRGWSGDLWGSWTHVGGYIREGTDTVNWDLPYIATDTLKLGTTFRYLDRYTVTPKLQWVGDTNTGRKSKTDIGDRIQTAGYTVAHLHLGAHRFLTDQNLSAYLDIYNLFDKRYYAAHGSASSTFIGVPQQPRTLMLSAEYRF